MPGDGRHHFFNSRDLLLDTPGFFEASFRLHVLRSQVGRHGERIAKTSVPGTPLPAHIGNVLFGNVRNADLSINRVLPRRYLNIFV